MANPQLNEAQRKQAEELLDEIRKSLDFLANGDPDLRFAFNRKVAKELGYDERGKPSERKRLKAKKFLDQRGKCAKCGDDMELAYSELHRTHAPARYTDANTQLVHTRCHHSDQAEKGYR